MADPTTTTPDQGDKPGEQKASPRAQLYLVLECDRSESDLELRAALLERLQAHRGNVSQSFGKARVQNQRWMKRFGFEAERFRK